MPQPAAPAAPDRTDSRTWPYDYFPATTPYDELVFLVDGYDGFDHYRMPWLTDARFTLTHNYPLATVSFPCEPWQYTAEMDWDDDQDDEAAEHTAEYEHLADALEYDPWNVPPLVVVERGCGHHDLIDGNHRAGLGLSRGRSHHPAYVTVSPATEDDCHYCTRREQVATLAG